MDRPSGRSSLLATVLLGVPALCCALPALVASGGLAAVGAWLGAHGFWVAGWILLLAALGIAVRRR